MSKLHARVVQCLIVPPVAQRRSEATSISSTVHGVPSGARGAGDTRHAAFEGRTRQHPVANAALPSAVSVFSVPPIPTSTGADSSCAPASTIEEAPR